MSNKVSVDGLAEAVMNQLEEYNTLAADELKTAVKKAGKTVKEEINASAPVRTGKYAKSWKSKTTAESSAGAPSGKRPCQAGRRKGQSHSAHQARGGDR